MERINQLRNRSIKYALEIIYLSEKAHEPKKGDTMVCNICGRKAHLLNNGKGPLVCCGKPMAKSTLPITEGAADAIKCKYFKFSLNQAKKDLATAIKYHQDHCKKTWKLPERKKAYDNCMKHTVNVIKQDTAMVERMKAKIKQYCGSNV